MENRWHEIWDNRKSNLQEIDFNDEQALILELKRIIGLDALGKGSAIAFSEIRDEYEDLKNHLQIKNSEQGGSVFEVGVGSGANLYFFRKEGFAVGGADYSEKLLEITKEVIGVENLIECIHCEASEIPTDIKYDAVFAAGVFQYFKDIAYVEEVLDRMLMKAKSSLAVIRVPAWETKEEFLKYRRAQNKNYDEMYKDTPHLFISKKFFTEYAKKHNLTYKFAHHYIKNFWNNDFIFNCFLYKND